MGDLLKVPKALSHETRLRIPNSLPQPECCVCEVGQAMQIPQTQGSHNLGTPHGARLLKARPNGPRVLYSIDQGAMEKS